MLEKPRKEHFNIWDGDVHIYGGRIHIDGEIQITIDKELTDKIIHEVVAQALKAVELAGMGGAV